MKIWKIVAFVALEDGEKPVLEEIFGEERPPMCVSVFLDGEIPVPNIGVAKDKTLYAGFTRWNRQARSILNKI